MLSVKWNIFVKSCALFVEAAPSFVDFKLKFIFLGKLRNLLSGKLPLFKMQLLVLHLFRFFFKC